jgi:hypothetical protein
MTARSLRQRLFALLVLALFGLLGPLCPSSAQASAPGIDMVVVFDMSGSMAKAFGGEEYGQVLKWLEEVAAPEDRVGMVTFGGEAHQELELAPSRDFHPDLVVGRLKAMEEFSDLAGVLGTASRLFRASPPGRPRVVFLVSDCEIDVPGGPPAIKASERYLLTDLLPGMGKDQVRIVTLMPPRIPSNYKLVQQIAELTRGTYFKGIPGDPREFRKTQLLPLWPDYAAAAAQPSASVIAVPSGTSTTPEPPRGVTLPGGEAAGGASWLRVLWIALGLLGFAVPTIALVVQRRRLLEQRRVELGSLLQEIVRLRQHMERAPRDEPRAKP